MCTASTPSETVMGSKKHRNRDCVEPPGYIADVLRIAGELKPGTVAVVNVDHDHDCALLAGHGACSCTPDVKLRTPS